LCKRIELANTFLKRTRGMMFRGAWEGFDGMLLAPCNSIHTFWMFMPIDVCFLDRNNKVLKILTAMKPWKVASGGRACYATLEVPAGVLGREGTRIGDRVAVERECGCSTESLTGGNEEPHPVETC